MEEGSELAGVMMVIIAKVVVEEEVGKEAAMKVNEEMIKPKSVN